MRDSNEASGPGPAPAQEGRLQGRHVLAIALTFFGVVFAVNGVFLFAALSTHTGVVANEPYRKGLAYNARIAAADRQDHLGWSDAVSMSADGTVSLALADKAGAAIEGLQVQATIGRPSTGRYDRTVALVEGPAGHYAARIGARDSGGWIVAVEAQAPDMAEPVFRTRRRLWLKP